MFLSSVRIISSFPPALAVVFTCVFATASTAFSVPAFAETPVKKSIPTADLSEILEYGVTGWTHSSLMTESQRKIWKVWAEEYRSFKSARVSSRKRSAWIEKCKQIAEQNPYCGHYFRRGGGSRLLASGPVAEADDEQGNAASFDSIDDEEPQLPPTNSAVQDALLNGKAAWFKDQPEKMVLRALKGFPVWEPLAGIVESALESESCVSPGLLTALALKAEEFFPAEQMRATSIALYEKALNCGDSVETYKAKFRLSLLYIWKPSAAKRSPAFDLSEIKGNDYMSRSLYWRGIAQNLRAIKCFSCDEGRLNKEYPLAYHTLRQSARRAQSRARTPQPRRPFLGSARTQSLSQIACNAGAQWTHPGGGDLAVVEAVGPGLAHGSRTSYANGNSG